MSTKLYEGFILRNTKISEMKEDILSLKENMIKISEKEYYKSLSKIYYRFIDSYQKEKKEDERTAIEYIKDYIEEESKKLKKGIRSIDLDFSFTISAKEYLGDTYIYIFYEQASLKKEFLKYSKLEEYAYWNNTDHPDDILETEWERRGIVWNKIMPEYSFDKSGFETIELLTLQDFDLDNFNFDKLSEKEEEKRIKKMKLDLAVNLEYKKQYNEEEKENKVSICNEILFDIMEGKYKESLKEAEEITRENIQNVTKDNFDKIGKIKKVYF